MSLSHVYCTIILITCMLAYYNSLNCQLVFDDVSAIRDNRDLRPQTPIKNLFFNDFWGTSMHKEQSHKSYRPFCVLTFRFNYLLHGLEPMGYHLVNVILHGIVCILYFRLCTMFLPELGSFVASMLFAVHPIHTEAVTGVVGRAESLSSIFFILAFTTYVKATKKRSKTDWKLMLVCSLLVAVAMLCKEQGITVLGVCAVYEIFILQKLRVKDLILLLQPALRGKGSLPSWISPVSQRMLALIATVIVLFFGRLIVMGSQLPVFTRFDNPASVAEFPVRHLTYNYLIAMNSWLLLFPCDLCCDWTMNTVPLIEGWGDPRNFATISTFAVLFLLAKAALSRGSDRHSNIVIMGLSLMVFPFLPASNLFFPVGFVIAERILYIPSMGFCLIVAYGWTRIYSSNKERRKWCWLFLAGLLFLHGAKTHVRNNDWESEYSIFMAGLRVNQRNAKLYNNVGHALESQGKYKDALFYFQKAVGSQADDIGAHINVGRTYNNLKLYKEAEDAYLKAKSLLPKAKPGESYQARIAPNHLNVFLNLANLIARNETRLEEADRLYRQAISMRADYTQAYINRGDILLKMNRTKEAQEVYERALFYDSSNPDIYYNLGVVYLEQGKPSQALAYLDKALDFEPEHSQALLNSAIVLSELGDPPHRAIAKQRLLTLLSRDTNNERAYFHMGMLAMDDRDSENAEKYFRLAIQLKEDFRSALFNLALLLADSQRPLEAAPFLNQLVKYHPDHIKGLILLGDIYINNIKDLDSAEACYQRILTLDPENVQGLHNLCVVYVERGDLLRAEKCFIRASQLAPHEEYIVRHLKIVQQRINKLTSVVNQNSPTKSVMQKSQNEFDDTFDVDHVDDATTEDGASDQNHPENDNSNDVNFGDNGSSKNYMPNTEKIFP
ncbi:protein O-mannosyl-transferase Tmtc3 isoform X2 [Folsomia candida]|nr:protein O-mannosyl-transferase Tmtc3 isoform X2 [Folsomia candida]XP_035708509.1 protein O-mannosyl-transferase Tmtc3 isoform X2 [Folsomia candida]XP_035708510.1 protein O-mannosyl-transferase Tmtc3 isoform X2 [Folsomia candida]